MRKFLWGVLFTMLVLFVGGLSVALLGYMPTHANATPPKWEESLAERALDASMEHHAPRVNNPIPATDENLIEGMKIYTMNCALCHGKLDNQRSPLEHQFYPPAPQLIVEPIDDPEWHIYYGVRTGVRYTAMPSWEKVLTPDQIWKVTGFLSHLEKLPPGVQDYWKNSFGSGPKPATDEDQHEHSHH
ncbi:MAG TPA: c-type cytochrome [Terriglobales bacterium]|nr:c-type cytochrome [Terriglobales bacterium]